MNESMHRHVRRGWFPGALCLLALGCAPDTTGDASSQGTVVSSSGGAPVSQAFTPAPVPTGTNLGMELGPPGSWGTAPADASPSQAEALEWVNFFRQQAGLPYVELVRELSDASNAHADFVVRHYDYYQATGLTLHEQVAGKDGFTGVKYWERIAAAGYDGSALGEVIAYQPLVAASILQWIDSVYHRLPLTHPQAAAIGYGAATADGTTVTVMELGKLAQPAVTGPVAFPPDGAVDVPVEWDGNEIPQPPTPVTGYPSGPIFTLQFPGKYALKITNHSLRRNGGADVAHQLLEPSNDPYLYNQPVAVVYADDPLEPSTRYEVHLEGIYAGEPFTWTSEFTTSNRVGCNMFAQDCRDGQGCFALGDESMCAWAGPVPVGGECTYQNDCGAGATCVLNTCRTVCDAIDLQGAQGCGALCQEGHSIISESGALGACNPLPCTPLTDSCSGTEVCVTDQVFACGTPGDGLAGATCSTSGDCATGHACAGEGGDSTCRPLCDASPLAGEKIDPLGDRGLLPPCSTSCPSTAQPHPQYADVGICL